MHLILNRPLLPVPLIHIPAICPVVEVSKEGGRAEDASEFVPYDEWQARVRVEPVI